MAGGTHKRPPLPVIALVVLAVVGGGVWWWWSATHQASEDTALQFSGTVEAREFQVLPALSGRVTEVAASEGDRITEGQALVTLDGSALELQLEQARQGVVAAQAALDNARRDSASTDADVTAARARVAQADAQVRLAQLQLDHTKLTAPRDGVVVTVNTNVGQNASPSKTALTMIDPNDLFVRVFVPETRIGDVRIGQPAHLTTDSSDRAFDGTVSFIASESEFTPNNIQTAEQRVKLVFEVRVRTADDSGTLKAGMPVDVTLG